MNRNELLKDLKSLTATPTEVKLDYVAFLKISKHITAEDYIFLAKELMRNEE